jgi:multicomponent K+:H+ antiporter subunit F
MAPGILIELASLFALVATALAMAIGSWRLFRGPSPIDRVLAIDTLYVNTVALVVVLGLRLGTGLLFEAALIVAALGFISTVALARYLTRGDVLA